MIKRSVIISMFFLLLFLHKVNASVNAWNDFIKNPTKINYDICMKIIKESLSNDEYLKDKTPAFLALTKNGILIDIYNLIENGNKYASQLSYEIYPLFRGYPNYQEQFNIQLGKLLKKDPELFLYLLNKYRNRNGQFSGDSILLNYGEEFYERPLKSIKETKRRIIALQKVKNKNLSSIKIKSINKLKKQLSAHKKEAEQTNLFSDNSIRDTTAHKLWDQIRTNRIVVQQKIQQIDDSASMYSVNLSVNLIQGKENSSELFKELLGNRYFTDISLLPKRLERIVLNGHENKVKFEFFLPKEKEDFGSYFLIPVNIKLRGTKEQLSNYISSIEKFTLFSTSDFSINRQ